MHNNTFDLLRVIKKASIDTINASKPVNIIYGTVLQTYPLEIQIEQKLILQEHQLVLTRNVTDYSLNMIVDHKTQNSSGGSGDSSFSSHNHNVVGTKNFTVLNALKEGEMVILIRLQNGEKYMVLDRIGVI